MRYARILARTSASLAAVALVAAGLLAAWCDPAWAAGPGSRLSLAARPDPGHTSELDLVASLSRTGTAPGARAELAGVHVQFAVHVPEFSGAPLLTLGTAVTNAGGLATFTYRPTWTGRQDLVASASGPAGDVLASARASVVVADAARSLAPAAQSARPDGVIGRAAAGTLLAIVLCLWVVLVGVVVRVHLAMPPRPR